MSATEPAAAVGHRPRLRAAALAAVLIVACLILVAAIAERGAAATQGCEGAGGLSEPGKKEIAMQIVSSAENSSLDWRAQYRYLEYNVERNRTDNRGYTGGIIGFTSKTGDMLAVVRRYRTLDSRNPLRRFIGPLRRVNGTTSRKGLGKPFARAWRKAAQTTGFRRAQDIERDLHYFCPAVETGQGDEIGVLGQFIYYDALVMHGPGPSRDSFGGIRDDALERASTPADGGDEYVYLSAFLDVRRAAMRRETAHEDTSRVDTAQRVFLDERNFGLDPPLRWQTYGDSYEIAEDPSSSASPSTRATSMPASGAWKPRLPPGMRGRLSSDANRSPAAGRAFRSRPRRPASARSGRPRSHPGLGVPVSGAVAAGHPTDHPRE